jgi:sulfite exporter TauE/SafE
MEYLLIAFTAFLGSYHCIGMCGFIPTLIKHKSWLTGNLLYSIGRVFSYTFLGFVAGYLGMFFKNVEFQYFQKGVSVFLGLMIIFFGLQIMGNIKEKGIIGLDYIYSNIADLMGKFREHPLFLGMFNGLLPCPLVYAFLMKAIAEGNPLKGALVMVAFGIGTIPAMLFASKLLSKLTGQQRKFFVKIAGFIVVLFGVWMILRTFGILTMHHHHNHNMQHHNMQHQQHQMEHHNHENNMMHMDN